MEFLSYSWNTNAIREIFESSRPCEKQKGRCIDWNLECVQGTLFYLIERI